MLAVKDSIRLYLGETLHARSFVKLRPRIIEEHRALLRAVEHGHSKSAAALLRSHLTTFYGS
jgi:GntR family transcriptional repressor for pyruvate dehydrogenase complex